MSDKIYTKSGALDGRTEMPQLAYDKEKGSELGYRTDTKELFIGSSDGNVRLCGAGDVEALNKRIDEITARLDALLAPAE